MSFGDEVGLFYDIPESEYHSLKIPSNSSIKLYGRLPALYEHGYLNKTNDEELSQALQMGKVFELLVLEPHRESDIVTFKTAGYNTKEAVSVRDMNPDKILISENDLSDIRRWAACMVKKYPFEIETKKQASGIVDFEFDEKSVRVKFRLDEVDFERGVIYDYKLMRSAAPDDFLKDVWDRGYDIQAALYTRAMQILFPRPPEEPWMFRFKVQEKHYHGYDTRFTTEYYLDRESIDKAWSYAAINLQLMSSDTVYHGYSTCQLSTEKFKWGR